MIRLISRGRFTQKLIQGNLEAPEDRGPAVRQLVEAAGARMVAYYITTGDYDFTLISEAEDADSAIAAMMVAGAAGTITGVTTVRAWTAAEFKPVAEKAGTVAGSYRAPGRPKEADVWSG